MMRSPHGALYDSPMDLEIRHLRLVMAIAETGSVTRAGGRLYLTQSALSHQLKDIEGRLGRGLFHRLGQRMGPARAPARAGGGRSRCSKTTCSPSWRRTIGSPAAASCASKISPTRRCSSI